MNRNPNRNTAAFDRWMNATTPAAALQPVPAPAPRKGGRFALAAFVVVAVAAAALPMLAAFGIV